MKGQCVNYEGMHRIPAPAKIRPFFANPAANPAPDLLASCNQGVHKRRKSWIVCVSCFTLEGKRKYDLEIYILNLFIVLMNLVIN